MGKKEDCEKYAGTRYNKNRGRNRKAVVSKGH